MIRRIIGIPMLAALLAFCFACGCKNIGRDTYIELIETGTVSEQTSPSEKEKALGFVKEINAFSTKELGFKKIVNFQSLSDDNTVYFGMHAVPKKVLPYDYLQKEFKSRHFDTLDEALKAADEIKETHDTYVFRYDGNAGGYPLTDAFVRLDTPRQIYLVIHEDWHDNIDMSLSLEEATGNILGYIGSIEFLKKNKYDKQLIKNAEQHLQWALVKSKIVVKYYAKLEKLYETEHLDEATLLYTKEEILKEAKRECMIIDAKTKLGLSRLEFNNATISTWMTYDRYLDVAYRVYLGTGRNLKKTAAIFRSIRPLSDESALRLWFFGRQTVKEYEEEVVNYLEQFAAPSMNNR